MYSIKSLNFIFTSEEKNPKNKKISPKWRVLKNIIKKAWQVPILPGGFPPSTFSVYGLNFWVRNGTRCTPAAILTKLCLFLFL